MNRFSVIIPVYNVKEYLEYCVQSLLNQTYQNFEIILVDDGSTDGSGELCSHLAREYPGRVAVIHQTNQGVLVARLAGIHRAEGEILLFLDSDDSLRADALEKISGCFSDRDCDLVLFDAGSCPDHAAMPLVHRLDPQLTYQGETKNLVYESLITGKIPNSVCLKAVRKKESMDWENLRAFSSVAYGEDLLMTAHLLTVSEKIGYLPEGLYRYRIRQGSAVNSFPPDRCASVKAVHGALEQYLELWQMPQLTALHNTRKVNGWVDILLVLLKHKHCLSSAEFETRLREMVRDPYFRKAYRRMDPRGLSLARRLVGYWMAKEQYGLLHLLAAAYEKRK